MNRWVRVGSTVLGLVIVLVLLAACGGGGAQSTESLPPVLVYKSPTCGCCTKWADHMRANGFKVEVRDVSNLMAIKDRYGVPPQARSCHTAVVGEYVVEGHVPAQEVKRLLTERPDVVGIAVPGMPIGSPGMEVPGRPAEPFEVVVFDRQGNVQPVARYPQ